MTHEELAAALDRLAVAEEGPVWMGAPVRWWEKPLWRCTNGHVSARYLKSERLGAAVCLACRERLCLTFPEDVDGPLPAEALT